MNVSFVKHIYKPIDFEYNGVVITVSEYQIDSNIPMIKVKSKFGEFQILGDEGMIEYPFISLFTTIEITIRKDGRLAKLSEIYNTINGDDMYEFLSFVESMIVTEFEVIK